MRNLIFTISLIAFSSGDPAAIFSAESTTDAKEAEAFNATCPVCVKPVDSDAKPVPYKASAGTKAKHPEMTGSVGFCSDTCRTEFEKDPAKYENTLYQQYTQWQEAKNTRVK